MARRIEGAIANCQMRMFITIPEGPGPKDTLVYVSPGVEPPEDCEHLAGRWYFHGAEP